MTTKPFKSSLAVSIKMSLLLAIVLLLVILGGISIMAKMRLSALEQTIVAVGRERLPQVRTLGEFELAVTRIRLAAVRLPLTQTAEQRQEADTTLKKRLQELDQAIARYQTSIAHNPNSSLLFSQFAAKWQIYLKEQEKILAAANSHDLAEIGRAVNEQSMPAFQNVIESINDGIKLADMRAEESVSAAETESAVFSTILLCVNGVSILIGISTLFFVVREVSMPIHRMTESMELIAKGNLETEIPYVERSNELGLMARALMVFRKSLIENDRLSAATRTLSELSEWLQSAKSEDELYDMLADVLARLMPECKGSLYIYANSRDALDRVKDWNGHQTVASMHPDACWGLRKGHTYAHGTHEVEFRCDHVSDDTGEDYCCIPILAHGETVGLLHLEYHAAAGEAPAESKARFADRTRLGQACAEHISIAIANVKLREELRDQSVRDVLTGLNNRRYLLEAARRELQRAARDEVPASVLSIDVDHFKSFNDNHGHDAGDTVLRSVGECMRAIARDDDIPCRYGGEEFVMLLPRTDTATALERAEMLRARIEALIVRYGGENLPRITISVGVATSPAAGETLMDLLKHADDALYAAKRGGRNRVELATICTSAAGAEIEAEAALDTAWLAAGDAPFGLPETAEPTAA